MSTPTGRREALEVLTRRGLSQRKACGYLRLSRRVATYTLKQPEKDRSLGEQLMAAAQEVPRFGYRRMSAWLALGESRVRRMWRALQLNIPRRRPRRRRVVATTFACPVRHNRIRSGATTSVSGQPTRLDERV